MRQNALYSLHTGWLTFLTVGMRVLHWVHLQTPLSYKLYHPTRVVLPGIYLTGHYRTHLELCVRHEMFSSPLSKGAQNNVLQDSD